MSKRIDAPYRSGPSRTWLKSKIPASAAHRFALSNPALVSASSNQPRCHSAWQPNPGRGSDGEGRNREGSVRKSGRVACYQGFSRHLYQRRPLGRNALPIQKIDLVEGPAWFIEEQHEA